MHLLDFWLKANKYSICNTFPRTRPVKKLYRNPLKMSVKIGIKRTACFWNTSSVTDYHWQWNTFKYYYEVLLFICNLHFVLSSFGYGRSKDPYSTSGWQEKCKFSISFFIFKWNLNFSNFDFDFMLSCPNSLAVVVVIPTQVTMSA